MTTAQTPYQARRAALFDRLGEAAVAVFPSAPEALRNGDVPHEYRQDSNLFYLTGFEEPQSALVLVKKQGQAETVLFLRERDPERETWDGPRVGLDAAPERLGVDTAHRIQDLPDHLVDCLVGAEEVHAQLGRDPDFDRMLLTALSRARSRAGRSKTWPHRIVDPAATVHEMRLAKTEDELDAMRRAIDITRQAHAAAWKAAAPGRYEYQVEAELLATFRRMGSVRTAYGSIVGSGPNATVLHYRDNSRRMKAGDLLLIDAGCELDGYASDVTRTVPIDGEFTDAQRKVYEIVLQAQKQAIAACVPSATLDEVHGAAVEVLTAGMIELGWIEGPLEEAIRDKRYRTYYMHGTSHWLGMDVHDVGAYQVGGAPRPLQPGMVLTVEPGLYVPLNAELADEWLGIGVRIEDDVAITEDGCEVLSRDVPKEVAELEDLLATRAATDGAGD